MHVAGADQRVEDGQDALDRALLHFTHEAQLVGVHAAAFAQRRRQEPAVLVDDGDILGGQLGHAGSHQPGHRRHLGIAQAAARVQVEQHRGGRGLAVAHEQRLARHGQVHAGVLHRMHGLDRARQLAFQAALVVDLLGELAGAETGVVQQLETHRTAARQALAGQLHARVVDPLGGHQQRAAVVAEAVGHVHLVQRRDDGAAIAVVQIGEQHLVIGLVAPHRHRRHHGDQRRRRPKQDRFGQGAQFLQHGKPRHQRRAQGCLLVHRRLPLAARWG
ncbi:Uncharacterised protein [Bordetella pertussis]|nr:Uncharacterised protein [Bordetella pertussis]